MVEKAACDCRNCLLEVLALGSSLSEWLSVFLQCLSTSDSPRGISETVEALPLLGLWKFVHTIYTEYYYMYTENNLIYSQLVGDCNRLLTKVTLVYVKPTYSYKVVATYWYALLCQPCLVQRARHFLHLVHTICIDFHSHSNIIHIMNCILYNAEFRLLVITKCYNIQIVIHVPYRSVCVYTPAHPTMKYTFVYI